VALRGGGYVREAGAYPACPSEYRAVYNLTRAVTTGMGAVRNQAHAYDLRSLCYTHYIRRRNAGTLPEHNQHMSPADAWAAFKASIKALGGIVLEDHWLGALKPHRVRCAEGHVNPVRPGNVQSGQGICETCAGKMHNVFYVTIGPRGLKLGISSNGGSIRLDQHRRAGYGDQTVRLWTKLPGRLADDT
jgi:hypothetical protein